MKNSKESFPLPSSTIQIQESQWLGDPKVQICSGGLGDPSLPIT